jgi:hypothetical protein
VVTANREVVGVGRIEDSGVVTRLREETKPSFKTTELMVLIAAVAAVLVASRFDDSLDGRLAWTLVTALAIGYMVSRGLAKSGTSYRDLDEDN